MSSRVRWRESFARSPSRALESSPRTFLGTWGGRVTGKRRVAAVAAIAWMAGATDAVAGGQPDIEVPVLIVDLPDEPIDDGIDEFQLVWTAAKRHETVLESEPIVTVITRDQIRERGYRTVADVLDDVPGFEGHRYHMTDGGLSREVMARGNVRTVLVLWNGVPLNTPETNARLLEASLPITTIDRIEVVSGPGGVQWGANAFLGIVSISTLKADRTESAVEVDLLGGGGPGGQDTARASATVAESLFDGSVQVLVNLTYYTSRDAALDQVFDVGYGPFVPPESDGTYQIERSSGATENERDTFMPLIAVVQIEDLRLDLLYPIVYESKAEITARSLRADHFVDDAGMVIPGDATERRNTVALASATYNRYFGRTGITARAYYTAFDDEGTITIFPAGRLSAEPISNDVVYEGQNSALRDGATRIGFSFDVSRAFGRNSLLAGAESFVESARARRTSTVGGFTSDTSTNVLTSNAGERFVMAAFAHNQLRMTRRFRMSAGLRGQVSPSAYDPLALGSVAMLWNPTGRVYFKLNAAQGFRPPPLRDILVNDDPVTNRFAHTQGNPDLRAERSFATEGEVAATVFQGARRLRYVTARTGYQFTRLDDLILPVEGIAQNAARREIHSAYATADVMLSGGHAVSAAYYFITGIDEETGPLRHIANHKLHLRSYVQLAPRVGAILRATVYGRREDLNRLPIFEDGDSFTAPSSSVIVDRLPPVALVHAGLRATDVGGFDVAVHVDNLLDARYLIPDATFDKRVAPLPLYGAGRTGWIDVTWRVQ